MATIIREDSEKVSNRKIVIPKNAKKIFKAMRDLYSNYIDNTKGGRVLKKLSADVRYDGKGNDAKHNGDDNTNTSLSVNSAKVILHRQNKFAPNTVQYQLYGGQLGHDILKKGIERSRAKEGVSEVPKVPEVKPTGVPKPTNVPKVQESVDYDDDWAPYYDYLSDYDEYYVLNEFMNDREGKESWGRLIQPEQYKQALSEFTRFGKLMNFPTKYVFQWMGIIMRNTAILRANTTISGHEVYLPMDAIEEEVLSRVFDDYEVDDDDNVTFQSNEEQAKELLQKYNRHVETVGDNIIKAPVWVVLDKLGLYDWMMMPDGSDAWSDFGIRPLESVICQYKEGLSAEETLVIINKALDITHQRGDLSSIFIVGGSKTLTAISESIRKKIVLTEAQIRLLKEYRQQLVLPFNGEENGQGHKVNYEHFMDYLEENGRYGELPPEKMDIERILRKSVNIYNVYDIGGDDYLASWIIGIFMETMFQKGYKINDIIGEEWIGEYEPNSEVAESIGQDISDILELSSLSDFEAVLTSDEMCREFESIAIDELANILIDHMSGLNTDRNGLIEIERAITLPELASQSHVPGQQTTDFFKYLEKTFNGTVGECWSWSYGDTYCGESYGKGTTTVYLKGKIQPSSVNWPSTAMLNLSTSLGDEDEIRAELGATIEIYDILDENGKSLGILKRPILVKA